MTEKIGLEEYSYQFVTRIKGTKIVPSIVTYHCSDCDFSDGIYFSKCTVGSSLIAKVLRAFAVSHMSANTAAVEYDLLYGEEKGVLCSRTIMH